ncbi:hypothetical protein [Natronomonas sp. EA1]|uniref:hypothetical protein n=1 Tax=Natronomonas sp. EA1 TaxID=3421655 RepID=UPI003EB71D10
MRLALDIETVSPHLAPDEWPDFEDSDDFELLAVALGHDAEGVETTVLFRDGTSPESELDLIERVLEWCASRDADTLVTFNGDRFDLLHLRGRAARAAEAVGDSAVPDRVERFLDSLEHDDLRTRAVARWGGKPSFEQACARVDVPVTATHWADYDHGMEPDDWRRSRDFGSEEVKNGDIPQFGERYLALAEVDARGTLTFRELERLLTDYARSDVEPLFALADAL